MSLDRPVAPDPYALLPAVGSFTVSSPDIADGQAVEPDSRVRAGRPGGSNQSPALSWSGFPDGHRVVRGELLRPGRADPVGLLALDGRSTCRPTSPNSPRGAGSAGGALPAGAFHVAQRLRHRRLRRAGPAAGRPGAPLLLRGARGGRARRWASDAVGQRRRWCRSTWSSTPWPGRSWCRCSRTDRSDPTADRRLRRTARRSVSLAACTSTWWSSGPVRATRSWARSTSDLTHRDRRVRPVRRHLPERRLHPDQDVRLPGRPGRAPAGPDRSACTPPSTRSTGRRMRDRIFARIDEISDERPGASARARSGRTSRCSSGTGRFTGLKAMTVDLIDGGRTDDHRRPVRAGRRRPAGDPGHSGAGRGRRSATGSCTPPTRSCGSTSCRSGW